MTSEKGPQSESNSRTSKLLTFREELRQLEKEQFGVLRALIGVYRLLPVNERNQMEQVIVDGLSNMAHRLMRRSEQFNARLSVFEATEKR